MHLRSQLPGSSPLPAGALVRSVVRTLNPRVDPRVELQGALKDRFGGEVVLLGSGTQALATALRAATALPGLGEGPVAIPAYSCFDIVSACVGAEVRVEFYDVDPETLGPDMDSLERVLRRGARVVVVGNLYGLPLDWDSVRSLVDAAGGFLVEDAAQGLGTRWNGRLGGTFGDMTVLSFGRGKGWTGGGGGALLLRDSRVEAAKWSPEVSSGSSSVRPLLGSVAQWALGRPSLYGLPRSIPALALGETVYKPPSPARAMATSSAALILATARSAEAEAELRRRAAREWSEVLPDGPWMWPRVMSGASGSYLRFPIVLGNDSIRHHLLAALDRFGASPGYPQALCEIQAAQGIAAPAPLRDLEGAKTLARLLLTLPTHSKVGTVDRRQAIRAFESARSP